MPFDRAVQALAGLEEKLRRAFNLAGPIGAKLDPTAIPVIIADDLRDPGHAFFVGRSWFYKNVDAVAPAGTNVISLLANADVLVEALFVTGTLAIGATLRAYVTAPSEAIPLAAASTGAAWRDRKTVALDQPPLLCSANWNAPTGTLAGLNNTIAEWRNPAAAVQFIDGQRDMRIMIPSGGTLTWRSDAASNITVGCWGRVFP